MESMIVAIIKNGTIDSNRFESRDVPKGTTYGFILQHESASAETCIRSDSVRYGL